MSRLLLYFHTLRFLRWQQVWYRLPVLKKIGRPVSKEALNLKEAGVVSDWISSIEASPFLKGTTFTFLNQEQNFAADIDWDYLENGLLWAYNLNYFEFLLQKDLSFKEGVALIDSYIEKYKELKIGHSPYPISLRLIFWIRFFLKHERRPDRRQLNALHEQAKELQGKLEYHLLGNHLLENGFALFFSGLFLRDGHIFRSGKKLLRTQLQEQILPDGGHFELSPMYHQLMLYRLLDCVNLYHSIRWSLDDDFDAFLRSVARKMLGWLREMTFSDGSFPLFNDAANGIAPRPDELLAYGKRLEVQPADIVLKGSGYRKWKTGDWECFMDVGMPGPAYQPGHAHCDMLNFEMQIGGTPVLVDTGTSVYGGDTRRRWKERSTAAHNTVKIAEEEQSEIWGDFRMARRAKILELEEKEAFLLMRIAGFKKRNTHQRIFSKEKNGMFIQDEISGDREGIACFHFHPDIQLRKDPSGDAYSFACGRIVFDGAERVEQARYDFAPFFGIRKEATLLKIYFKNNLKTHISQK